MKGLRLGSGFVIFVLFFGVAALDAFRSNDWVRAIFWFAIGVVFHYLCSFEGGLAA